MSKTHFKECCVCGQKRNLTFEHIPPRKTHNTTQVMEIMNPIKFFEDDRALEDKIKNIDYRLGSQKGIGDYTLCSKCNNYFGSHYANEFTPFYNELADFFKNNYDALVNGSSNGDFDIDIKANINFFKFEKQVVSMLMSTSGGIYKNYFKEYLLDENNTNFPTDKFKIIMNGYLDFKVSRITGQMIGTDLASKSPQIVGSEIQVFPLGFTLIELNNSNKEKNINYGLDITNWFKLPNRPQTSEFTLRTYKKPQPFPHYLTGVTS